MIQSVEVEDTKVVGFVGSPRKGGNTDTLVQQVLDGARSTGAETSIHYLNELQYKGCQDCRNCKKYGVCGQEDGMIPLYYEIMKADGIIIGTPVYFGQMSGQTKTFLDRWYAFVNPDFSTRLESGKKVALIYPQWSKNPVRYKAMADHFVKTMAFFGLELVDTLAGPGLHSPGDAGKREVLMEKAYKLGKILANKY